MAVPEQTPYSEHTGNGVTKSFALDFICESKNHLIVFVDEIEPPIATWSLSGGNVVFTTAPISGSKITIQRNTPFSRTVDYQSYNNSFRPQSVNGDFDRVWWKLQELGVADWILSMRIDALKNYVDRKDDELKAYLMEEIRKQGVALDQLDDYYNYLMQRLAQIAVDKGWDASFVTYSGVTQERINDGLESVADMLAIVNPKDGMRVTTKSYLKANFALAQPYKGGLTYIYNSSKSTVNDGVSCINGWIAQFEAKYISTDHAGLLGNGTDTNATARLQSIMNAAQDGFTINIIGKYITNQHVMPYGKKDLKIIGTNSDIIGDPDNWVWSTSHIVPDVAWYHPRGILMAYECPNVEFSGLKILGIRRNNKHPGADQFQDGDCSISVYNCDGAYFHHNNCSNNYAWGIMAENSINCIAHDNNVSVIIHQSGINICNGASSGLVKVYNNEIDDVGLYGIEFENRNEYDLSCYDNVVKNCYAGIMTLSDANTISGTISDNKVDGCVYGLYPTNSTSEDNTIAYTDNTVVNSANGVNISVSSGVNVTSNKLFGINKRDVYMQITPTAFIAEVLAPNKFLVQNALIDEFNAAAGSVFYAKETALTFTSVVKNTQPWSHGNTSPDFFYVITIAENVLDESFLFRRITKKELKGKRQSTGIQRLGSLKNNYISNNIIDGFVFGTYKDNSSNDAEFTEIVSQNTFRNNQNADILAPSPVMGCYYLDNTLSGNLNVTREIIENGRLSLDTVITKNLGVALSSASGTPAIATIYIPQAVKFGAVFVELIGASATTGRIQVGINGSTYEASTVGSSPKLISISGAAYQAATTMQIKSTVADLTYTDVRVTLLSY